MRHSRWNTSQVEAMDQGLRRGFPRVHAAVKVMAVQARARKESLDLAVAPVDAGFWPLKGHLSASGETGFGDNLEVAP